jgi:hypothetical protein
MLLSSLQDWIALASASLVERLRAFSTSGRLRVIVATPSVVLNSTVWSVITPTTTLHTVYEFTPNAFFSNAVRH